jgi:hypothetical protein
MNSQNLKRVIDQQHFSIEKYVVLAVESAAFFDICMDGSLAGSYAVTVMIYCSSTLPPCFKLKYKMVPSNADSKPECRRTVALTQFA